MSDLFDVVARKTGEDCHEIARRSFVPGSLAKPPVQIPGPQADLAMSISPLPKSLSVSLAV